MSIVVAGTFRIAPERLAALKPHFAEMAAATAREDGCLAYAFAEDLQDPGLLRVFERWRDHAALDAHLKATHVGAFRKAVGADLREPSFKIFDIAGERKL